MQFITMKNTVYSLHNTVLQIIINLKSMRKTFVVFEKNMNERELAQTNSNHAYFVIY